VATQYSELGEALLPLINPALQGRYGIQLDSFIVENISLPPEVEQAIDKRSSMAAVGNLNDFVKYQMAQGLQQGGGAGGFASEMAVGWAMAQQMMQQQGGVLGQATPAASQPGVPPIPDLLSLSQAAQLLGVGEDDVTAVLASGELKGKKIGNTWRITRAAVDDFLKS
jgi:excisionase family DNA binding protein